MANTLTVNITNCKDCKNHYCERIYTADSFEHEEGMYCSLVTDKNSYNHKHRLIASDDIDVTRYSDIPDWCPMLNMQDDKTYSENMKIMIVVGGPKCYKSSITELVKKQIDIISTDKILFNGNNHTIKNGSLSLAINDFCKKKYENKNIIIEVCANDVSVKEIEKTVEHYKNCEMVVSCFDPNTFTVHDMYKAVDKIVAYFKNH